MSTLDDITAERQRIAEQLARIDAERTKLAEQLADLEATERVLARFTQPLAATHPGRRRAAKSTGPAPRRRQRGTGGSAAAKPALALGDASLRAMKALGNDISAEQIRDYLAREFGMRVRPNHLGMALQRHRRAGRLEQRDARWWIAHQATDQAAATA